LYIEEIIVSQYIKKERCDLFTLIEKDVEEDTKSLNCLVNILFSYLLQISFQQT